VNLRSENGPFGPIVRVGGRIYSKGYRGHFQPELDPFYAGCTGKWSRDPGYQGLLVLRSLLGGECAWCVKTWMPTPHTKLETLNLQP